MDNSKYKKLYLKEAASHLEGIEKRLLALEKEPSNGEIIDGLFRHYHSMKGMSASMGYTPVKELAHVQEDRLSKIRDKKTEATAGLMASLFSSLDRLKEFIGRIERDEPLEQRCPGDEARAQQSTKKPPVPGNKAAKNSPAPPLRLSGMVKVESSVFDELLSTAGELFMILSSFKALTQKIRDIDFKDGVHNLEKTVERLHNRIFSTRMLPIEDLTGGLPRIVRDIAGKSEKAVNLKIKGADISVDRAILDDLASPLVHIIRNAVDHGIEPSGERQALGKPPAGSIIINAYQKRQRVVIEISDDGRGIDVEGVRRKLIQSGLAPHKADAMSANELLMATCTAGLSTTDSVTDTSGRGVGMDVVKDVVEGHGGSLYIDSKEGVGTTISMELPRTTSIIRTLLVTSGGEELLAPISLIEKVVEIENGMAGVRGFEYDGKEIPVVDLAKRMGIKKGATPGAMLIVEPGPGPERAGTGHVGILVDNFGMEMEAYVKTLSAPLMKIWGVSGVTVMGDGRPVFILDIAQIISGSEVARAV